MPLDVTTPTTGYMIHQSYDTSISNYCRVVNVGILLFSSQSACTSAANLSGVNLQPSGGWT